MSRKILSAAALCCILFGATSQTTDLGNPMTFSGKFDPVSSLTTVKMPSFDIEAQLVEDEINNAQKVGPWRFGYEHITNFDLSNSGAWETTAAGDRIWRIHLHCQGALSTNVVFNDFFIPEGGKLHLYNLDHSDVQGAYTSANNNVNNSLGSYIVHGEHLIVEYYEPLAVKEQGRLLIGMVVHGYKQIESYITEKVNESGGCNMDVICPDGDDWRDEIRSVARILNGGGLCTGTLMNNTNEDGTPYFLTADHCGPGSMGSAVFKFNYDSPTCGSQSSSNSQDPGTNDIVNGSVLRANRAASDFGLIELNSTPPAGYAVYYAGWDNTGATDATVTGIHHPAGDVKKLAFDDDPTTITSYSQNAVPGNGTHIRVETWERNTTTEGGSSGSAIWNQDHRVVGQLHGGGAACGNTQSDWYGRLFTSWDGTSAAVRLRDWLDPSNSSSVLDGWDPNQPTVSDDGGVLKVIDPNGTICGSSVTPQIEIKNYGTNNLTSLVITYDINGGTAQNQNWTGNLAPGATDIVTLSNMTLTNGAHTLNVATSLPNGNPDQNGSNDSKTAAFQAAAQPRNVTVSITLDEYGSETTWSVEDASGNVWASGGPYADQADQTVESSTFCLYDDCFDFIINDAYGDGLCCQYGNGSYVVIDDVTGDTLASGGTFTTSETTNFCLQTQALGAVFNATDTVICVGSSIDFNDMSTGAPTTWTWDFPGAVISSSSDQNPSGVTYNTPGTYDVTLTVGDGSTTDVVTLSSHITVGANPTASSTGVDPTCAGDANGSATAVANGGTPGYTYSWAPSGGNSATASGLAGGSYTVTVTDANGCQNTSMVTLNDPAPVSASITGSTDASCGQSDGTVTVQTTGGNGNYTYSSDGSNYQAGATLTGLSAGTYMIYTQDDNGCLDTLSHTVVNPNAPSASATGINESCQGECDGQVSVTATGGTPSYNYVWSNGANTDVNDGVCAGTYDVTITDASGCETTTSFTIGYDGVTPTASMTTSATTVYIDPDATVDFTNTSTGGSTTDWDFGDGTSSTLENPSHTYTSTGTYTVTLVVGDNGCSDTITTTIVVEESNGIVEYSDVTAKIFPNPTSGEFTIQLWNLEFGSLSVNNVIGQEVKKVSFNSPITTFNGSEFGSKGTYFIKIHNHEGQVVLVKPLVIQ